MSSRSAPVTARRLWGLLAVLSLVVAACGGTTEGDEEAMLDLDTLTAETEVGTVQAQHVPSSYVGAVGEGRVIGIAAADDVRAAGTGDRAGDIVVYLYDRQDLALMIGDVQNGGQATLASDELSDFEATVELMMGAAVVEGTVTLSGEEPIAFTAEAATGVAGVYWAEESDEERRARCDWVVLADGRQWGCVCVMPPMMPEHPCCRMMLS